jgi:NitT/TauT family transport system permease protein
MTRATVQPEGVASVATAGSWRDRLRERTRAVLFYVGIVLAWEIATAGLELMPAYLLPAPSAILVEIVAAAPLLLTHTLVTLTEILLGFLLGTAVGIIGALGVLYSPFIRSVIYPLAVFSQAVPKIALAPLFIVWFGFGLLPKVIITALICLFPVLINASLGLTSIDPRLMELLWSLNASRRQILLRVQIPHAVPYFFSGLQVAITLAVVGAVVAEWVGADRGLGYLLLLSNSLLQTTRLFAELVLLSAVGVLLFYLIAALERAVSPHRASAAERLQGSTM